MAKGGEQTMEKGRGLRRWRGRQVIGYGSEVFCYPTTPTMTLFLYGIGMCTVEALQEI